MSIMISVGTIMREDPNDPHSPLRVNWPGPTAAGHPGLSGQPVRAFNARGWLAWRRSRSVRALLAHCHVPADVDHRINALIDDSLFAHIEAVCAEAERWAWLPWADPIRLERAQWLQAWALHARATFGDRAYLGFS